MVAKYVDTNYKQTVQIKIKLQVSAVLVYVSQDVKDCPMW